MAAARSARERRSLTQCSTDLEESATLGNMANQFTAVIERDGEWFIAYAPEIPGANGQGKTKEEALESLSSAISLILEDRREDGLRGLPPDAVRETVTVK
jgi:predicted RNase H-like HicB family nuclease